LERDLIINVDTEEVEIALLEDRRLAELHQEKTSKNISVGDVYLGTVRKLIPGLNAAFVDIGEERDAFLHYTDLGPYILSLNKFIKDTKSGKQQTSLLNDFKIQPQTVKSGKIGDVLQPNDQILVQVEKEPISTKGARVSSEITLPGRYMVLHTFYNHVSVSRKIRGRDERKRLQRLCESIKPGNFGIIVRTAADKKKVQELNEDLTGLVNKWDVAYRAIINASKKNLRSARVLAEDGKTKSILRDLLNDSFNKIVVNNKDYYNDLREYVTQIAPGKEKMVQLYNADKPIFDNFSVRKQIKSSFGSIANLPNSAYLVIEPTEALNVVDVNSGNKVDATVDAETNALNVNINAAREVARQMRLRDMGGITVIDFIDMRNPANKKKVLEEMQGFMKSDRAKHTILPLTKFNLMQITRQRVRPETAVDTSEVCPTCDGKGKINASILVVDDIERELNFLFNEKNKDKHKSLKIFCHPYVAAYLKQGTMSQILKWQWHYKKRIKLVANNNFHLSQLKFIDAEGIIKL
jgi:ribonuclease G